MQTGRIKIVLHVDGHWAYSYPTVDLKRQLGDAAYEALSQAYDRLEPLKRLQPINASAWPEQDDEP